MRSSRIGKWGRAISGSAIAVLTGVIAYRRLQDTRSRTRSTRRTRAAVDARHAIVVRRAVTVRAAPADLYQYWRQLSNLPRIMRHLESVEESSPTLSHWVATGPAGTRIAWDAEIIQDVSNERIAWRSINGATVVHAGSVRFRLAPGDRGTEIHVELSYEPPDGAVGAGVAKLFGEEPDVQIREDLRRFKQSMEAGEIPTTSGQPHGGR